MGTTKFRGKRSDNGELVYGSLFYWNRYGKNIPIIGEGVKNGSIIGHEVDPETIGQFTGLFDKNGKEIYEGDVVRCCDGFFEDWTPRVHGIYPVEYCDFWGAYAVRDNHHEVLFHLGTDFNTLEVLGNIHDNPELLKQE